MNPVWEESYQISVEKAKSLEIGVFSRSLVFADGSLGTAILRLDPKKVCDHELHEVWLDLVPQGKILLRIAMDGDVDDVDFYFRKTTQGLKRCQDGLVRSMILQVRFLQI